MQIVFLVMWSYFKKQEKKNQIYYLLEVVTLIVEQLKEGEGQMIAVLD